MRKYPFTVASFLVCQAIRILLAIPILLCDKSLFLANFKYYVKNTRNPINIVFLEVSSCYHEAILRGYITGKAGEAHSPQSSNNTCKTALKYYLAIQPHA